ncbi:MAG: hypothetical protein ACRC50_05355, partial [Gaiella sp.]
IPNPPDESAPDGDSEDDAEELRRVGEPPAIAEPREASEIGRFELERAVRLSGSRFGYLVGDTALLAMALYRFALDHVGRAGFTPVLPPCSCARRRWSARASSRPTARTSTRSKRTSCT